MAWVLVHWARYGVALNPMARLDAGAQNAGVLGQLAGVVTLWATLAYIRRPSWVGLACGLAMLAVVYTAGGRSHIFVTLVGVVVLMAGNLLLRVRRPRSRVYGFAALSALVLVATLALWPRLLTAYTEVRAYEQAVKVAPGAAVNGEATAAVGTSVGNRAGLYHVAHQAFTDSPWLGFGAGTARAVVERYSPLSGHFAVTSHYHQQYIQVLMDTGVLGMVLASVALWVLTRWMHQRCLQAPFLWACYLALLGSTAAVGLFTGALQQGLIHTFLVTSLAVLGAQACRAQETHPPEPDGIRPAA
jgi:O-antigen ligase